LLRASEPTQTAKAAGDAGHIVARGDTVTSTAKTNPTATKRIVDMETPS